MNLDFEQIKERKTSLQHDDDAAHWTIGMPLMSCLTSLRCYGATLLQRDLICKPLSRSCDLSSLPYILKNMWCWNHKSLICFYTELPSPQRKCGSHSSWPLDSWWPTWARAFITIYSDSRHHLVEQVTIWPKTQCKIWDQILNFGFLPHRLRGFSK